MRAPPRPGKPAQTQSWADVAASTQLNDHPPLAKQEDDIMQSITVTRAPANPVRRFFQQLLDVLDGWAFDELDARARAQGWQVVRPAPLTRVYRNPEFDTYVRCRACQGEGLTGRGTCHDCLGSGRVRPC
jgi:hypothetical protein